MNLIQESEILAFDFVSARSRDKDGRLHVSESNISKANVCPYLGREIPNFDSLGLDADKTYMLYRHPEELKKAAESFRNLPILREHVHVTANDDKAHRPDLVIGSTGSAPSFDGQHLKNSLVVWEKNAIDRIIAGDQKELSSAYYYDADMTPGTANGQRYDGIMRNIRGNHVAIVKKGRAGPSVVVGDAALSHPRILGSERQMEKFRMAEKPIKRIDPFVFAVESSLRGYLAPKLAADAELDLRPIVKDLTPTNFDIEKVRVALDAAVSGKLAKDLDIADVTEVLQQVQELAPQIADLVVGGAQQVAAPDPNADPNVDPTKPNADPVAKPDPSAPTMKPDVSATKPSTDPPAKSDPSPSPNAAESKEADKNDGNPHAPLDPKKDRAGTEDLSDVDNDGEVDEGDAKVSQAMEFLKGKLTPEDLAALEAILGGDTEGDDKMVVGDKSKAAPFPPKDMVTKTAMDAAITCAVTAAVDKVRADSRAAFAAKQEVIPYVGEIKVAMDTAEEVYKYALDKLNVTLDKAVPPSAYGAILRTIPVPGARPKQPPRVAQDAATGTVSRFGDSLGRLKAS